jgi:hypothetical protein
MRSRQTEEKKKIKRRLTMKTNLTRTLLLAAVALTSAASAFAEIKAAANVPFSFRASGKELPASAYSISKYSDAGAGHLTLTNNNTGHSIFLPSMIPADGSKDARPRLVFRCGASSGCALAGIYLADGHGWKVPTPRLKPAEIERMAMIYIEPTKAE